MTTLRSGPLAAWARAWIAGSVSLDQVLDAVRGDDAPHLARNVPGLDGDVELRDVLVTWRRTAARPELRLPVPGDVRGLPGPRDFRADALEIGESVVAAGLGVVPHAIDHAPSSAPTDVVWHAYACDEPPVDHLDLRESQHDVTSAIRESASALARADVAGSSRAVTDLLGGARRAGDRLNLPPGHPGPAVALLAQAERLQAVLDLVSADPQGGAVDRSGIAARHDALRPLATAVRRARVAAYNA